MTVDASGSDDTGHWVFGNWMIGAQTFAQNERLRLEVFLLRICRVGHSRCSLRRIKWGCYRRQGVRRSLRDAAVPRGNRRRLGLKLLQVRMRVRVRAAAWTRYL